MTDTTSSATQPQTAKGLLKALQQEFPVFGDCLPMAIGIDKQLMALRPEISRKLLRSALGMHAKSLRYLKVLQSASTRFNLDGSAADAVSEEQRALAAKTLHEHFKKQSEQRKAEQAAEKAAEAAKLAEQERMAKLAQLAEKFSRK